MPSGRRLTEEQRARIRERLAAGERSKAIAAVVGCSHDSVDRVRRSVGMVPRPRVVSPRSLSLRDRVQIETGRAQHLACAEIGRRLGRPTSTVTREIKHNSDDGRYDAIEAQRRADETARRPKTPKFERHPRLRAVVEEMLALRFSPEQIAHRLPVLYPNDPEMRVSHETIYESLFVQGRGGLRNELHRALRTGRAQRRPRGHARPAGAGKVPDKVMISERPADVADRAVPGHWEGDLIMGKHNRSAIATLVERSTRYLMLCHLPDGHSAEAVKAAITAQIQRLPSELVRTLTWDQGTEMAKHIEFTVDTGVQVYFCDPHSPWQRGTNENTNGLCRQYFPKGSDLSVHDQDHLDAAARELNIRPRQTLGWMTPSEKLAELVATNA
jgi:transposase, IS30 family